MPTLQEILENDMGLGTEKVASAEAASEIDRLASELGIDVGGEDAGTEKLAGVDHDTLNGLYSSLFPEDSDFTEKTAEEEKVAYEHNLGARTYDYFAAQWDRRIEKLAEELMAHDDTPPQRFPDNKAHDAAMAIDTHPMITDAISAEEGDHVVGHYEQKTAAIMDAAIRKHMLLSQLED